MVDHRTKAYRDIVSMMPKPDGHIEETIGGVEFRYMPERRCRVCSADDPRKGLENGAQVKRLVDDLILYPKDVADIFRTVDPLMEKWPSQYKISYKSLRTHQKKHLPWDSLALRQMVERWASEKGMDIIDAAGRMILTEEAWLEGTVHKGWQLMLSGQIEPTWKDTQAAWERISQIRDQAEGEFDKVTLLAQLNAIIEAVRESVPPEVWPRIIAKIEGREPPELPSGQTHEIEEELFEELLQEQEKRVRE